ncbi:hypothetical protein MEO41_27985, partial [Dolichospermum sp. ST_sed4]|nr:hypothetical protein [Dolichospermum sp. ST_sed4]
MGLQLKSSPETVANLSKPASLAAKKPKFNITLTVDNPADITLGHLEYIDWRTRKDFHITIIGEDGIALDPNSETYKNVLESLSKSFKILYSTPLKPDDSLDTIKTTTGYAGLDLVKSLWTQGIARASSSSGFCSVLLAASFIARAARLSKNSGLSALGSTGLSGS